MAHDDEKRTTLDQATMIIMVASASDHERREALKRLSDAVMKQLAEPECPECGSAQVMDNGETGRDLTYCCESCGYQWDPEEV